MKDYRIRLFLKTEENLTNIRSILEESTNLGFTFESKKDKELSTEEAIEELLREHYINCIIDDAAFVFYLSSMCFTSSSYYSRWKKQFLSYYIPDNIKALNLLLDITNNFIIRGFWISSYLQLLNYPKQKSAIVANSLIGAKRPNEDHSNYSDGNEIYVKALIHGYTFISMPNKKRDLEAFTILDKMQSESTYKLYLMVDNHVALLEITSETVSIIAQEPIKIKIVGEQQDYDRAFYTRILLNLLENIGIDEIVCTL